LILKQKNIIDSWIIRATGFIAPLQAIYKEANITYDRNGNLLTYPAGASIPLVHSLPRTSDSPLFLGRRLGQADRKYVLFDSVELRKMPDQSFPGQAFSKCRLHDGK
jgi:hypothetical protein